MAWFDGTFDYSEEELKAEFPVVVTKNLRQSEDGNKLAILNDFPKDTEQYRLSDPKAEEGLGEDYVFFHAFAEDAAKEKQVIKTFFASEADKDGESITLFRQEPDRLFSYANGHICKGRMENQSELRALFRELPPEEEVFILPLKRYLHQCPVCRQRTLLYRGFCEICKECGWEDDGTDDENERPWLAHHDQFTVKEYREKYMKRKAANPFYAWYKN